VDAFSSLIDVIASLLIILCIQLAYRPPDEDHPFGHGRYEPISGLLSGVFLCFTGGVFIIQQAHGAIQENAQGHLVSYGWIFPFICMIILEYSYRLLVQIAKQEHSTALAADAMHYRIDSVTSLFATLALLIAAYVPQWSFFADHAGAIAIALFMLVNGFLVSRANFNQLIDKAPAQEFFELVKQAALKTKGVQEVEKIKIQQYGPDAHVDIDIEVFPELSVDKAHKISQHVRLEIQKAWPAVQDVTVHIEPFYANDH
jgi:cation diffusion facilitator family transporter